MEAESTKSPPSCDCVELVPSSRGGKKAKYGGHTFTGRTNNGVRYHWRCDVRDCSSRLTTDVFGTKHLVYFFKQHDKDEHRRAESNKKRRRSEATHKQQPWKRIEDCDYVLEKQAEGIQYWRCKFVQCHGRCRTNCDGVVVAGPSLHSPRLHPTRPTTAEDGDTSTAVERNHLASQEDGPHEGTVGTSRQAVLLQNQEKQEERHEQMKQPREEAEEEPQRQNRARIVLKLVKPLTKSEQPSGVKLKPMPSPPPATQATDVTSHVASPGNGDQFAAREDVNCEELAADAKGPTASRLSSTDRDTAALKQEADASIDDADRVDIVSSEDDDMDDAEDNFSHSSVGSECCDADEYDKSSQVSADYADKCDVDTNDDGLRKGADNVVRDLSHAECDGYQACREELLERTLDSSERELRGRIFVQMRCLLEAETQLANRRRQVEILRESLLERQLKNLVSLRAHSKQEK